MTSYSRELENQGVPMSNPQSPRYPPPPPFQSSSAVLDSPFSRRGSAARQPILMHARSRSQQSFVPEQIWGQYNNYRSNGLVGSAIVHVVLLPVILAGASFGLHVVHQAIPHDRLT